jgi:hypothetical protein
LKQSFVKALFVVATPSEETPADARLGLRIRFQATISGRCACDGSAEPSGNLLHETDCPAISDAVTQAILGERVRWVAVPALIPAAR